MPQSGVLATSVALGLATLGVGCTCWHRIECSPKPENEVLCEQVDSAAESDDIHPISYQTKLAAQTDEETVPTSSATEVGTPVLGEQTSNNRTLTLDEVIHSVYASHPLLDSALVSRDLAYGNHLAAHGNFDLKIKGTSESGPLGFYKTYRKSLGLVQPLYSGSEIWGGYRIGRGSFQPWYLERQTNDGGEFKAGLSVPLLQNRSIDERRAELWRTRLGQQLVEYDIHAQVIGFVQEASYAYWEWVAAGQAFSLATRVLDLADSRTTRIEHQVEAGLIDPPELTDNLRLVAERRAKLADARRKLEQKGSKLSLYLRDAEGRPSIPNPDRLPSFPEPVPMDPNRLPADIQVAHANRPEMGLLATSLRQLDVDHAQAENELQPEVNAFLWGAQDIGAPTSSKQDKSPFELEAGLYVDLPLQRRKARGKIMAIEAKIQQLNAKQQWLQDKIAVEVQVAYAGLIAALDQVNQAREAVRLAEELAKRERRNFEAGISDLLKVTLREEYAAEAAGKEIDALLKYHCALADYDAARAANRP